MLGMFGLAKSWGCLVWLNARVWFGKLALICLNVRLRAHRPPPAGTRPVSGRTETEQGKIIF